MTLESSIEANAELYELRSARRELAEALVRVTEERDVAQAAYDSLREASIEHTERHRAIFDEHLHQVADLTELVKVTRQERDEFAAECQRIAELNRVSVRLLAAERDEARQQLEKLDERRLREIETLRTHGLAVSQQLRTERDEARAEVVRLGRENEQLNDVAKLACGRCAPLKAENDRLQRLVDEAGWPGWDAASRAGAVIKLIEERDELKSALDRTAERDAEREKVEALRVENEQWKQAFGEDGLRVAKARLLDALGRSRRPWTDDERITKEDGTVSTCVHVKRACNGCGELLGDVTDEEMDRAVAGLPSEDVRGECLTCTPLPSAAVSLDALSREVVRLRTIITELGAAEAAEPPEEIEALRLGGAE